VYAPRLIATAVAATVAVASLLAAPVAHAAAPTSVYVALGDSYSSGEGACKPVSATACSYLAGTATATDDCHRSNNGYPLRVAAKLPKTWRLVFAACSGATTGDFLSTGQNVEPAQLAVLATQKSDGNDVKLVTMTLGGNDAGFVDAVGRCVTAHTLFGSSCHGKITWNITTAALRTRLTAVYAAVHGLAPNARVFVLGYPRVFSSTPSATAPCPVSAQDSRALSKAENVLNASIAAAVAHANKVAGKKFATFVDNGSIFKGHELCAGPAAKAYLNGLLLTSGGVRSESFHPNRSGQSVLAAKLLKVVK
jgi:lysophospholipase L1-like esterase